MTVALVHTIPRDVFDVRNGTASTVVYSCSSWRVTHLSSETVFSSESLSDELVVAFTVDELPEVDL